ncbi:MAG: hypothetical protein Q8K96_06905 [Rubrivivax sp.]|nr:hypothetical protein [Rubrivivax sp.]
MGLINTSGKIKLLRVNEVGDRFGPAADFIEAEVVVQLDTHPAGAASGFKLRADGNQPVREGMLDLLRDAFNHGWRVHFDHEVPTGKKKGTIVRVWVTKDAAAPPGVGPGGGVGGLVFGTVGTVAPAGTVGGLNPSLGTVIRRDTPE